MKNLRAYLFLIGLLLTGGFLTSNLLAAVTAPPIPSVVNNCGSSVLTRATPPAGIVYYWQGTNSTGTSTSNSAATYTATASVTYYIRAYSTSLATWSPATAVSVSIKVIPVAPTITGSTPQCPGGNYTMTATSSTTGSTFNWYLGTSTLVREGETSYTAIELSSNTLYSAETYKNGCLSSSKTNHTATVRVLPANPTITAVPYKCGPGAYPMSATPPAGSSVKWFQAGVLKSTNLSYTPTLTADTTKYKITSNDGTCESTGANFLALIKTVATTPNVTAPAYACGNDAVGFSTSVPVTQTVEWWLNNNTSAVIGESVTLVLPNTGNNTVKAKVINGLCNAEFTVTVPRIEKPSSPSIADFNMYGKGEARIAPVPVPLTYINYYYLGNSTLLKEAEGDQNYYRTVTSTQDYTAVRWDQYRKCSTSDNFKVTVVPVTLTYSASSQYLTQNTITVDGEIWQKLDLPSGGGTFTLNMNTNANWWLSEMPDWLKVTNGGTAGGAGVMALTMQYNGNYNTGGNRLEYFMLRAGDRWDRVYISQPTLQLKGTPNPNDYLVKSSMNVGYEVDVYEVPVEGGDMIVDIETNTDWSVTTEPADGWLSVNTVSTEGEVYAKFDFTPNVGGIRTGTIQLKHGNDIAQSIYVRQRTITALSAADPRNFVMSNSYGEGGRITGQSIQYYDKLGRPTQQMGRDITGKRVLASQTVYDDFGRPLASTMAIPLVKGDMNYVEDFLDENTLKNDGEIGTNVRLGQYYSETNTTEPFVPVTGYPYATTYYSSTLGGAATQSTMPGDAYRNGQRTVQSYSMPAGSDELLQHPLIAAGVNIATLKVEGEISSQYQGLSKSITIDVEGKESVAYYNAQGQAIASCMSATNADSYLITRTIAVDGENGYIDIHLPAKGSNYTITKGGGWHHHIVDLKNEIMVEGEGTTVNLAPGVYRFIMADIGIAPAQQFISYSAGYAYYSFSAYDAAGRPVRSLSPKDVEEIVALNQAGTPIDQTGLDARLNRSNYNSLGQVLSSYSPDEGETKYMYRKDGKIRFSQNAKQKLEGTFSYTNYDKFGRLVEAGECVENGPASIYFDSTNNRAANFLESVYDEGEHGVNNSGTPAYRNRTNTVYDHDFNSEIASTGLQQHYLKGNVSKTWNTYKNSLNISNTTWYSYTYDGKIEYVIQKQTGFADTDPATNFLVLKYTYDYDGNVTSVVYQPGSSLEFTHYYQYDFDGRLLAVYTKTAGEAAPKTLQAKYFYYKHGALKRVELADKLQGIDYVYNLNGWLKSINHPSLNEKDPGGDGFAAGGHSTFGKDVFGMTLDYYSGDYVRANTDLACATGITNRYDGNISLQRWQNKGISLSTTQQDAYKYEYDQRNFMGMATFGKVNIATNAFTRDNNWAYSEYGATTTGMIAYDANGNIKQMGRRGAGGTVLDNLAYNYDPNHHNRLALVDDDVALTANSTEDIDDQGVFLQNTPNSWTYKYNAIGQMTGNKADGHFFEYDVYGKVIAIYATQIDLDNLCNKQAEYLYDDRGFRICKIDNVQSTKTWYQRDLSGNLLAIFTQDFGAGATTATLAEVPVYGASRLGQARYNTNGTLGSYAYELSDHLGNVRAVIGANGPGNPDILSYADYYPGGMTLPGRNGNCTDYRFSYQGQFAEKDAETGYNQFEARLYDARIGRWLTTDPAGQYWSPYLGMGNNPINGVDPNGELFGKMRAGFGSVFRGGIFNNTEVKNVGGDWVVFKDGEAVKNYGGSLFNGKSTNIGVNSDLVSYYDGDVFFDPSLNDGVGDYIYSESVSAFGFEGDLPVIQYKMKVHTGTVPTPGMGGAGKVVIRNFDDILKVAQRLGKTKQGIKYLAKLNPREVYKSLRNNGYELIEHTKEQKVLLNPITKEVVHFTKSQTGGYKGFDSIVKEVGNGKNIRVFTGGN